MKKFRIITVLLIIISVLFTACGQPEQFETAPVITTSAATTEAETYVYSEYSVLGTKMGMSIVQTQNAIGSSAEVSTNNNGNAYFIINKTNLPFVSGNLSASVYFLFDENFRLCGVQYQSTQATGFSLDEAIKNYDGQYGKHISVKNESGNTNYVWYYGGIYAVITVSSGGQNAMSFFGKQYFEKNYKEEANAYNK